MPNPQTITLSLTEKDFELIRRALITEIFSLKADIKQSEEYPESDYFAKYAAEAKAKIPLLEDLHSRVSQMTMDAKYPLLRGEEA